MHYASGQAFLEDPHKAIAFVGMSGVGKTSLLKRFSLDTWFNYSVDYRIGTRHLSEAIHDDLIALASAVPALRALLRSDSIYIRNNITWDNLEALSRYIGKLGNPDQGGRAHDDFVARQARHREAEIAALTDIPIFQKRSRDLYAYPHFLIDAGGSICEVMDFDSPGACPVYQTLKDQVLVVALIPDETLMQTLIERQLSYPKPLYFRPEFLQQAVGAYLRETGLAKIEQADPDAFVRFVVPRLNADREPRYRRLGQELGVCLDAQEAASAPDEASLLRQIAASIDTQKAQDHAD